MLNSAKTSYNSFVLIAINSAKTSYNSFVLIAINSAKTSYNSFVLMAINSAKTAIHLMIFWLKALKPIIFYFSNSYWHRLYIVVVLRFPNNACIITRQLPHLIIPEFNTLLL
jgi:hypothetical protein